MEELARTFVNKENWPVLTVFSLFYQVGFAQTAQQGGEER